MQQYTFIGEKGQHIWGFAPEIFTGTVGFWESRIHPADKEIIAHYRDLKEYPEETRVFEYRILGANGNIAWVKDNVCLTFTGNASPVLRGIIQDITAVRQLSALEKLEKNVFLHTSDINIPLRQLLLNYLTGLEALFPRMLCSIHKVKNGRLHEGVSPSLPAEYIAAIDNLPISENNGSCGSSAASKKQVIVSDIATDTRWGAYRDLAMRFHLKACWSNPVIDSSGEVIATLAMYYREIKLPGEEELQIMDRETALLRVILENRQKADIVRQTNLLMIQSQELAHFGNWKWDIEHNVVTWSPALYAIYGVNSINFKATFEGYLERLHPDDGPVVRSIIENVLKTGEAAEFEERIIRPSGEIRHLRSWAKLIYDSNGIPVEMIGACLDNTEKIRYIKAIEQQNHQLLDIAWMQSHVVRSPLTRIMSIVELLKTVSTDEVEKSELLKHLSASADELDAQIKAISKKTQLPENAELYRLNKVL